MSYTKNSPVWVDENGTGNGTLVSADRMNHIEDGIVAASEGGGGVPVYTASDYTVPDNTQVMFSGPVGIETDGYIILNGFLVEVD